MNQYFTKVTQDHWQPKNKLQEEAQEVARDMERRLIPESELRLFVQELETRIEFLNKKYNRCIPIILHKYNPWRSEEEEITEEGFYIPSVFHLTIYKVKA